MAETKFQTKSSDKMLLLKGKVSEELNWSSTGSPGGGSPLAGSPGAIAASWMATLPLYDETGTLQGYIPIIDSADFT